MHQLVKFHFTDEQLIENFNTLQDVLAKAKPSSAKGTYFQICCCNYNNNGSWS